MIILYTLQDMMAGNRPRLLEPLCQALDPTLEYVEKEIEKQKNLFPDISDLDIRIGFWYSVVERFKSFIRISMPMDEFAFTLRKIQDAQNLMDKERLQSLFNHKHSDIKQLEES
jgi:hypothetical protein